MKDEELFKAWKSEQYKDQSTEERFEFVEHLHTFPKYFEQAFLEGLKAGRPQWHDLRKDPNDLPERISLLSKTVINQIGTPCQYNYALECWQNWSNTEIETPIAWCEIPTFDKE